MPCVREWLAPELDMGPFFRSNPIKSHLIDPSNTIQSMDGSNPCTTLTLSPSHPSTQTMTPSSPNPLNSCHRVHRLRPAFIPMSATSEIKIPLS